MLSQAAGEPCEKAEARYLTIISWHTLGEADLFFRSIDKRTDDKGVFLGNYFKNTEQWISLSNKYHKVYDDLITQHSLIYTKYIELNIS